MTSDDRTVLTKLALFIRIILAKFKWYWNYHLPLIIYLEYFCYCMVTFSLTLTMVVLSLRIGMIDMGLCWYRSECSFQLQSGLDQHSLLFLLYLKVFVLSCDCLINIQMPEVWLQQLFRVSDFLELLWYLLIHAIYMFVNMLFRFFSTLMPAMGLELIKTCFKNLLSRSDKKRVSISVTNIYCWLFLLFIIDLHIFFYILIVIL